MISIEMTLIIMAFTLMAGVVYTMYRYFDNLICELTRKVDYHEENGRFGLNCEKEVLNKRMDLFEQKLKDGLQANSICCRSSIDRINSRFAALEKDKHGSINVVISEPKKDKDNGTRKPTTPKNVSSVHNKSNE
jgi:hypothetical protein